jgi:acetylornithine deacetylase/succinyl-diaminopimelate desuccinylase-like protein
MTARARILAVLAAIVATPAFAAEPSQVAAAARAWRIAHEGEILADFVAFLAIPNLASDRPNIERNAAAVAAMLESRGASVNVLRVGEAPPLVVGDMRIPGATRTLAFYAHYDGQPVDETQWTHAPWDPIVRDRSGAAFDWRKARSIDPEARVYARGAGDDKAPIIAMMAALDVLRASSVKPAVNLRFVFEGEEEAGSPHLAAFLERYPNALRADAWLLCDGPVHQSGRAELFFGARGVVDFELTVYGPIKGLHDGHYGNWVPNPVVMLSHLIASMRDEDGRILIKGFYDDVVRPTDAEREAVAAIPDVERQLVTEFAIARTEGSGKPLNELLMLPALNVRGIESGHVGTRASNTLQTQAQASLDVRMVPAETPESVKRLIEAHIESKGYRIVRDTPDAATRAAHPRIAKVVWGPGYPPARTALDLPLSREVAALMTAAGREPVRLPTAGGSVPMYLFQQPGNRPVIGLPIANHDDNQHAPDENLRLQNLWDGIEIFATLFAGLKAN